MVGGKTTLAKHLADALGAVYVHSGRYPHLHKSLARTYMEAMLPALLGYQPVVMDRSWLSELPYGLAYRGGQLRLVNEDVRMLERVALRCNPMVVMCNPGLKVLKENFKDKTKDEYLPNEEKLLEVAQHYESQYTALPQLFYNYAEDQLDVQAQCIIDKVYIGTNGWHRADLPTAGSRLSAKYAIVGEAFAEPKDNDPLFQYPFVSFSNQGCSRWLTNLLDQHDVTEDECFWANADQLVDSGLARSVVANVPTVLAFGNNASEALGHENINHVKLKHPQAGKRFGMTDEDLAAFRAAVGYEHQQVYIEESAP